jgi:signal transduction histidine kinase
VDADPAQMRQLFQNLIGNALKYHRPGVPPVVKVWGESGTGDQGIATREKTPVPSPHSQVTIIIEDNGIGFNEKHAERIFQPFQRLVGKSEYEGSGMGLAICRKVVERHGGSITATSTPGDGTKFIVTLPCSQPGQG